MKKRTRESRRECEGEERAENEIWLNERNLVFPNACFPPSSLLASLFLSPLHSTRCQQPFRHTICKDTRLAHENRHEHTRDEENMSRTTRSKYEANRRQEYDLLDIECTANRHTHPHTFTHVHTLCIHAMESVGETNIPAATFIPTFIPCRIRSRNSLVTS